MGAFRTLAANSLLPGLLLLGSGCSQRDKECLVRVSRKLVERAEGAGSGVQNNLNHGIQNVRPGPSEHGLESRIRWRMRWDRNLADAAIEVHARDGVVELKGKVMDLNARRRAVELATTTVGVERVVDRLEVEE